MCYNTSCDFWRVGRWLPRVLESICNGQGFRRTVVFEGANDGQTTAEAYARIIDESA